MYIDLYIYTIHTICYIYICIVYRSHMYSLYAVYMYSVQITIAHHASCQAFPSPRSNSVKRMILLLFLF